MPVLVKEISEGGEFSRSLEPGSLSDSQTRVFRVIVAPGEYLDIQAACGIYIGNPHPSNTNIYCSSFNAKYEGKSRTVILCTFQYGVQAGGSGGDDTDDPQSKSPEDRTAKLTTSTTLMELPSRQWQEVQAGNVLGGLVPAVNPAGDMYDGVTKTMPVTTITLEQYENLDPMQFTYYAGDINSQPVTIGGFQCQKHTLMFRGVARRPYTESWGGQVYRGYMGTYEFMYRPDRWYIDVPVTGRSVLAFAAGGATADQDVFAQPLKHTNGRIVPPLFLADNVSAGDKVQAMVRIHEYETGGIAQTVAGAPVPLNLDGTPRKYTADPPVLVKQYCQYLETDFVTIMRLRLG